MLLIDSKCLYSGLFDYLQSLKKCTCTFMYKTLYLLLNIDISVSIWILVAPFISLISDVIIKYLLRIDYRLWFEHIRRTSAGHTVLKIRKYSVSDISLSLEKLTRWMSIKQQTILNLSRIMCMLYVLNVSFNVFRECYYNAL